MNKYLFIHLPGESYRVFFDDDDDEFFDERIENITKALEKDGPCWIPVVPDNNDATEQHIFLTKEMKKRVFLRTVVA